MPLLDLLRLTLINILILSTNSRRGTQHIVILIYITSGCEAVTAMEERRQR